MKIAEVRNLSTNEIRVKINDAREEYMNLRFQMAIGGLKDFTRLRYTRREIARLLTVLNERSDAAE
jgi:large subunit ribosomal protein L29